MVRVWPLILLIRYLRGSFDFWKKRLEGYGIESQVSVIFNEKVLFFNDPDGMQLQLVVAEKQDNRVPWTTDQIGADVAIRGFHTVTLTLRSAEATVKVLTDILGYSQVKHEGNRYRFTVDTVDAANFIDILEDPAAPNGRGAAGTNHHIAFRVKDDNILMEVRKKVVAAGLNITPKIDRDYFFSLYFREPGGVLFEIATDNPGFTVDESLDSLGSSLRLPKKYEGMRQKIEEVLPVLE